MHTQGKITEPLIAELASLKGSTYCWEGGLNICVSSLLFMTDRPLCGGAKCTPAVVPEEVGWVVAIRLAEKQMERFDQASRYWEE